MYKCRGDAVRVRVGGILLQYCLQSTEWGGGGGEYILSLLARVVSVTLVTSPGSPSLPSPAQPGGRFTSSHLDILILSRDGIFTQLLPVSGGDGCHRKPSARTFYRLTEGPRVSITF